MSAGSVVKLLPGLSTFLEIGACAKVAHGHPWGTWQFSNRACTAVFFEIPVTHQGHLAPGKCAKIHQSGDVAGLGVIDNHDE